MAETITAGVLEFCPEKTYSEEWDWDGLALWYRELTGIDGFVEDAARRGRQPARARRRAHGARARGLREQGGASSASGEPARARAPGHAARHRHALDGPPAGDGLPQGRHRPARDGSARSARRVQDRGVRHVRRARRQHQRGLPAHAHAHRGRVRAASPRWRRRCPARATRRPPSPRSSRARRPRPTRSASAGRRPTRSRRLLRRRAAAARRRTVVKDKDDPWANVGRNDPCPCGSGKKYKKCHGANA